MYLGIQPSLPTLLYLASEDTRSTGGRGSFAAHPAAERMERAPLMHWTDDLRRAKLSVHLSQFILDAARLRSNQYVNATQN